MSAHACQLPKRHKSSQDHPSVPHFFHSQHVCVCRYQKEVVAYIEDDATSTPEATAAETNHADAAVHSMDDHTTAPTPGVEGESATGVPLQEENANVAVPPPDDSNGADGDTAFDAIIHVVACEWRCRR